MIDSLYLSLVHYTYVFLGRQPVWKDCCIALWLTFPNPIKATIARLLFKSVVFLNASLKAILPANLPNLDFMSRLGISILSGLSEE